MFGGPAVSYHQTYSTRDWVSILRTPYPTQNLQRKHMTVCSSQNNIMAVTAIINKHGSI